jgi:hypothetical protein
MLIQGREPVSQRAEEESSDCIKEPEKAQEPTLGAPFIRLVRTQVQIQTCPQEAEGESDQLLKLS